MSSALEGCPGRAFYGTAAIVHCDGCAEARVLGQRVLDLQSAIWAAANCECEICRRPNRRPRDLAWPHLKDWRAIVALAEGKHLDDRGGTAP